jgi:hypothetical protein
VCVCVCVCVCVLGVFKSCCVVVWSVVLLLTVPYRSRLLYVFIGAIPVFPWCRQAIIYSAESSFGYIILANRVNCWSGFV